MRRLRNPLRVLLSALLLSSLLLASACEDSVSPGTLIVDWSIATSCSAANIDDVVVRVLFAGTSDEYDNQRVKCDVKSVTFTHVPPGNYDIRVAGVDAKGVELYVGQSDTVGVADGQTVTLPKPVLLSQKKGAIDVSWDFEQGLCSSNKVGTVQVVLFDNGSNQLYPTELANPFPCDPFALPASERTIGTAPEPGFVPAGILLGDLNAGDYVIHLFGLDETGNKTFKSMTLVSVKRGEVTDAPLQLVPCNSPKVPDLSCN